MITALLLSTLPADLLPLSAIFGAILGAHLHAALPLPTASVEAAVLAAASAA